MAEELRTPVQRAIDNATNYLNKLHTRLTERTLIDYRDFDDQFPHLLESAWLQDKNHYDYKLQRRNRNGRIVSYSVKSFIRRVSEEVELMPVRILINIYSRFFDEGVEKENAVYDFVNDNAQLIDDCFNLCTTWRMHYNHRNEETLRHKYEDEMYKLATKDYGRELQQWEIRREVSLHLSKYPMFWTWDRIYTYFLRNNRHGVVDIDDPEYYLNDGNDKDKYRFNLGAMRNKYADASPWKSVAKLTDKTSAARRRIIKSEELKDSFNVKAQRKLMKHYVAPRFTFVIDYFFAGRYRYLLAINVNTRKAFFAIPREIYRIGHNWRIKGNKGEWNVSAPSTVESILHIMENTEVRSLIMDNESAFKSDMFRQFLQRHNIAFTYVPKYNVGGIIETQTTNRSTHTTSLIDRLCRTLRQMNNNLSNRNEINPPLMNYLIDEYNNSVHRTLSKILGRAVSPNDVDGNVEMETELVKRIRLENFRMEGSLLYPIDKTVRVYNDADSMDKIKPKLLPGTWEFVERINGLYKLKQGKNTIVVPRWMIRNAKK